MNRILIASPTAAVKNYCTEQWLLHLNTLTYIYGFDVVLVDNTPDKGENISYLNELIKSLPLKFKAWAVGATFSKKASLFKRMCAAHQACADFAKEYGFKHMLHLESDVFPESNVIEKLLENHKKVCGALYYRDAGVNRRLMVQRHIYRAHNNIMSENFKPGDDVIFIDGKTKEVAHVGLGCVLIHTSVFEKIKFRFKKGSTMSVDSYFAEDCMRAGIKIYADTSLICRHEDSIEVWNDLVSQKVIE
ncbi:MAG: hypothetical protein V4547_17900 [Bacteroidota bacterium]